MKSRLVFFLLAFSLPAAASELPLETIRLPPGFRISVYADNVPGARSMALGPNGTLFVGTRGEGKVYAVATHHGWKFIRFGPDGLLYVPVGAPCNICKPDPARYAAIFRLRPDGKGLEQFAGGVRNTVGFDWDPATGQLWFTDNGRDWLGNDIPPDELNHAPRAGMNFGYPYCHGKEIADPEFGTGQSCGDYAPPEPC